MASDGIDLLSFVTGCKHCRAKTKLHLCNPCTASLQSLLEDLPWLLRELETTVQRQDALTTGAPGKSGDTPAPINLTALDLQRATRETLLASMATLTSAPGMPGLRLNHIPTPDLARTLAHNTNRIAHHPQAGIIYANIHQLTADDEIGRPGPLWKAINRQERIFAGPCPTIRTHDHKGQPVRCDTTLYAGPEDKFTHCSRCENTIDVAKNRMRAAVDRDLLPEPKLLEVMDSLGEKLPRVTLYAWLKQGRIQPRGYIHQGTIVQFRIRRGDPRVFSLSQARALRSKDQEAKAH